MLAQVSQISAGMIYRFTGYSRYFINKDNVFEVIKNKEDKITAYITGQKLATKKEAGLVAIGRYYNSL